MVEVSESSDQRFDIVDRVLTQWQVTVPGTRGIVQHMKPGGDAVVVQLIKKPSSVVKNARRNPAAGVIVDIERCAASRLVVFKDVVIVRSRTRIDRL